MLLLYMYQQNDHLATKSFDKVGADHGVTGQSIVNFLKRHGVDYREYKKQRRDWVENPAPARYSDAVANQTKSPDAACLPEPVKPTAILKALEDDAYESQEIARVDAPGRHSKNGSAEYGAPPRPIVLMPWPHHTDFSPDELAVRN
jgi:hypothetical protein